MADDDMIRDEEESGRADEAITGSEDEFEEDDELDDEEADDEVTPEE